MHFRKKPIGYWVLHVGGMVSTVASGATHLKRPKYFENDQFGDNANVDALPYRPTYINY